MTTAERNYAWPGLRWRSWVFDCDGVLLDSNRIKTEAMRDAAIAYGGDAAAALVRHHVNHGGVSRFEKFRFFFENILGRAPSDGEMESVLERFARSCQSGLLGCALAPGLAELMAMIPESATRLVVSGGAQDELRHIFSARGIAAHFEGIYGSPDSKEAILSRITQSGGLQYPAVFVGDSRYDYEVAMKFNMDFIFVHGWTEFGAWREFFRGTAAQVGRNLADIAQDRLQSAREPGHAAQAGVDTK